MSFYESISSIFFFFFFSSRRRHTRSTRDWSSDVCSSDLAFIGKEALERAKEAGLTRRLCCLVLGDERSVALGNEPVRSGDRVVARVTSGGQGYSVGSSIAYAYMPIELSEPGTAVTVEVFGRRVDAEVRAEPLFDPKGERIRA